MIRRKVFWFFDFLSGGKIRGHVDEIHDILSNSNREKGKARIQDNLSNLLAHAVTTTTYYNRFENHASLQNFPIIDKNVILDQYEDFKSSEVKKNDLFKASSSGSTGVPFTILQDNTKRNRNTADVIYFTKQAGGEIGDKLFYIKLWDHTNFKRKWETFIQHIHAHNVMDTTNRDMEELVTKIKNHSSYKTILGYPSFYEELCDYMDSLEESPNMSRVNCIISIAEALKQHERERMAHYFNAPVFERYSNQENGILAQQTTSSDGRYVLNWGSYYFEILELDSDEHVKPGGLGRIVVTDLFNFAMPMIRYDTGDMGIYEESEVGLPYLSKIYGRRMDTIYNTSGVIVSPFIFYMVLDFSKIKQFQFIQTNKTEYLFKLNANPSEVNETEIMNYFRTYLGEDAVIQFSYVDEIPLLSSGKRKKIVNEFMANA